MCIWVIDSFSFKPGNFNIANWVWPVIIGGLIIIWILVGIENLGKINTVAMAALFILTLVLSFIIFGHGSLKPVANDGLTFGAAVELAVAIQLTAGYLTLQITKLPLIQNSFLPFPLHFFLSFHR